MKDPWEAIEGLLRRGGRDTKIRDVVVCSHCGSMWTLEDVESGVASFSGPTCPECDEDD